MSQQNKTVEEKMDELRQLATWFESEEFSLNEATTKFEAASKLATEIESDLAGLENQITVLKESFEEA